MFNEMMQIVTPSFLLAAICGAVTGWIIGGLAAGYVIRRHLEKFHDEQ